jgi:two-component system, NarL family, response regulator NreC
MRPVEDDEQRQLLVCGKAVLGARRHEQSHAFAKRRRRVLDLEDTASLEYDIDLILVMGLLPIGLWRDEHVHTDLESRRAVYDLVPAATLDQRPAGCVDIERVGGGLHKSSLEASARRMPVPQRCESRRPGQYSGAAVIRVLIVDDHALVRTGLRLLLDREDDIEVVGEAGDGDDGVRAARLEKPDVVLLDVVMPDRNGIEACADVIAASKGKVLMLSMQDDPSYVREAFAAGASGYVLKEAADAEVVAAIREVAGGHRYVHPALGARMVAADAAAQEAAASDPLSDREREVLRLLALGHTNQEIAKQLFISVRTAETHRAHIMRKLQLSTRAELVRYAIEHGQLEPPA